MTRADPFHATPPAGMWINDPNALYYRDGQYHLLVQHAADAPDFQQIGWGRFTSADLMQWRWEGIAIAPDADSYVYSGSVARVGDDLVAFYTRHDPASGVQRQYRAPLDHPDCQAGPIGPIGRNRRDPFVFRGAQGWHMLVAAPADWTDWAIDCPSLIEVWQSDDAADWRRAGTIGPWHAPGIVWEVPVLLDFGAIQALIISTIDRRGGNSACSVHYWLGHFDGARFERSSNFPEDGVLLDLGPDLYAAIPNAPSGWPDESRVLIGWASNWDEARTRSVPGSGHGGVISLPRAVHLDASRQRLVLNPIDAARRAAEVSVHGRTFELALGTLSVACSDDAITAVDRNSGTIRAVDIVERSDMHRLTLFRDGPLMELFIEPHGVVVTKWASE